MTSKTSSLMSAMLLAVSLTGGAVVHAQGDQTATTATTSQPAGTSASAPPTAPSPPQPTVPDLAADAYRHGDFDALERVYATYGQPGLRSPLTGTPRIEHFWMGIGQITSTNLRVTEGYYAQLDAITRKWSTDRPQSVLAQLLYAHSLTAHAWYLRGGGYANTVSPAAWEGFRKYLEMAQAQLKRTETLAARDSSWNALMLRVGQGLGWDVRRQMAVFENGIAKNPDHDALYFSMQSSLGPKWGGDQDAVERFIANVTQRTRDKRGLEMYARLYGGYSNDEVHQSLFQVTRASWPTMKTGFEDRLSRYPHTDNRNQYAYFACMAKDLTTLREQLGLIGNAIEPVFWGASPERSIEECKTAARLL